MENNFVTIKTEKLDNEYDKETNLYETTIKSENNDYQEPESIITPNPMDLPPYNHYEVFQKQEDMKFLVHFSKYMQTNPLYPFGVLPGYLVHGNQMWPNASSSYIPGCAENVSSPNRVKATYNENMQENPQHVPHEDPYSLIGMEVPNTNSSYTPERCVENVSNEIQENPQEVPHEFPHSLISQTIEMAYLSYKCKVCLKEFTGQNYLVQHINAHHKDKEYKCSKCGKRFETEEKGNKHLLSHTQKKNFKCQMCPKEYNYKSDLIRHEVQHSNDFRFICNVCNKGFPRNDHMLRHRKRHFE